MVSKNRVDSLSLRNASVDDEGIARIKEAVASSGNLKVCVQQDHRTGFPLNSLIRSCPVV